MKQHRYSLIAILLHWSSAVVVIGMFAVGVWMVDLDYYSSWYQRAPHWHMSVGILLAMLTIYRLVWKLIKPVHSASGSKLEQSAAKLVHALLYLLLFTLFFSGFLIPTGDGRGIEVFDWFTVPSLGEWFADQKDIAGEIHEYVAYGLIGLVILHALAAIKHHVIDKDDTLKKMLKP